jgi:N-acetyl-anhydromuramyl-L-alanine amidase AmpD
MLIKLGSKNEKVKEIQEKLKVEITGEFDKITEAAVRNFQRKKNLVVDGIVGPNTAEYLLDIEITSDNSERASVIEAGLVIDKYYLQSNEYFNTKTSKNSIFLHHTAGWDDPYQQVRFWERDKRGRVGTQFLIGGINSKTGDSKYDGVVVQCFDDEYWAGHLGNVNKYLHTHSIGIELCNFGWLVKKGNNFYTWANTKVQKDQVIELKEEFRGYKYYHRYSEAQIKSLEKLLNYLSLLHGIDIEQGIQQWIYEKGPYEALAYSSDVRWSRSRGLFAHTNVSPPNPNGTWSKWDINPQPDIMDMISGLINPNRPV